VTQPWSSREFFRARRHAELPAFIRVFKALPHDKLDYTPHPRSPTAAALVCTLVSELRACCELADAGQIHWHSNPLKTIDEMVAEFEGYHRDLDSRVSRLDEEAWTRRGQFLVDSKVTMDMPIGDMLWMFFFDAIHHRGQLSTYIRPMGGTVPSIYGPSGDSPPA